MSSPDTWMPLFVGDYLADTMHLNGAQHGAYLLLLMNYWRNGPLPTDEGQLAAIARTERKPWAKDVWPAIRQFFTLIDGRYHQKRADKELARAKDISSKKRAAAEARWSNGSTHEDPPDGGRGALHKGTNGDASAMHVHDGCMPPAHPPDMLRAGASPSQSQKDPPRGPPVNGGAARRGSRMAFADMDRREFGDGVADLGVARLRIAGGG